MVSDDYQVWPGCATYFLNVLANVAQIIGTFWVI